jgi:hypothetical protein
VSIVVGLVGSEDTEITRGRCGERKKQCSPRLGRPRTLRAAHAAERNGLLLSQTDRACVCTSSSLYSAHRVESDYGAFFFSHGFIGSISEMHVTVVDQTRACTSATSGGTLFHTRTTPNYCPRSFTHLVRPVGHLELASLPASNHYHAARPRLYRRRCCRGVAVPGCTRGDTHKAEVWTLRRGLPLSQTRSYAHIVDARW